MARKTIRDLRIEAEIAERREEEAKKSGGSTTKKKTTSRKKATKKKTTRKTTKKAATAQRRRLMWAVFNGGMKEEARFHYHERELAEEKLQQLRDKAKKQLYFIQPLKVRIAEATSATEEEE